MTYQLCFMPVWRTLGSRLTSDLTGYPRTTVEKPILGELYCSVVMTCREEEDSKTNSRYLVSTVICFNLQGN